MFIWTDIYLFSANKRLTSFPCAASDLSAVRPRLIGRVRTHSKHVRGVRLQPRDDQLRILTTKATTSVSQKLIVMN